MIRVLFVGDQPLVQHCSDHDCRRLVAACLGAMIVLLARDGDDAVRWMRNRITVAFDGLHPDGRA